MHMYGCVACVVRAAAADLMPIYRHQLLADAEADKPVAVTSLQHRA